LRGRDEGDVFGGIVIVPVLVAYCQGGQVAGCVAALMRYGLRHEGACVTGGEDGLERHQRDEENEENGLMNFFHGGFCLLK
jgi:hypothetical protein